MGRGDPDWAPHSQMSTLLWRLKAEAPPHAAAVASRDSWAQRKNSGEKASHSARPARRRTRALSTPTHEGQGPGAVAATSLHGEGCSAAPITMGWQEEGGRESRWPRRTAGGMCTGCENTDVQPSVCPALPVRHRSAAPLERVPGSFPGCTAVSWRKDTKTFLIFHLFSQPSCSLKEHCSFTTCKRTKTPGDHSHRPRCPPRETLSPQL